MNHPFFTIITVCYQAEETIEQTIDSVLAQTFSDIEYVIVDGASTDKTLEIIEKYRDDPRVTLISEKDQGIYDAMNKGAKIARGAYVEFLNSGDTFTDPDVLTNVHAYITEHSGDLFYGDIVYRQPDGGESVRRYSQFCSSSFYYLLGDSINHQSLFAERTCFDGQFFDLQYAVVADRDWLIRMKKQNYAYKYMNMLVCNYSLDPDSFSIVNMEAHWKEVDGLIKKYYPAGLPVYRFLNLIRHGKVTSKVLHSLYRIVYIGKTK